jgi:adenylate/nucleoside-diphosphate kinase
MSISAASLAPDKRAELVLHWIGYKKQCRAKKLIGEIDFKALLTQDLEDDKEPRQWSLWKQIDPVALSEGRVAEGTAEFAVEYAGKVFVFVDEKNQELFYLNPKRYLTDSPKMPDRYKLLILGPRKSGKRTQAEYLSARYGWRLIDVPAILEQVINSQKFNMKDPKPSHPDTGLVQLPNSEFKKVMVGEAVQGDLLTPVILHRMGIPLHKKPPPPPEPVESDHEAHKEEDLKSDEESDHKEESFRQAGSSLNESDIKQIETEESPDPVVYEDLPLSDIVVKPNPDGSLPYIGGFIMIGYPMSEEEARMMKDNFIEFDKIIYLTDPNEGEILRKRGAEEACNLEINLEQNDKAVVGCKEVFGEEIVQEIEIEDDEKEVLNKILMAIDPFYLKADDPNYVISKDDINEDRVPLYLGNYGKFDPVVYARENWLVPGSEDNEVTLGGKLYTFSGEKETEEFKKKPGDYVNVEIVKPPPPHIMFFGVRGSGTTTQLSIFAEKYQIPILDLKQTFLDRLAEEKQKRLMERFYRRGFKAPEFLDEDEELKLPAPEEDADLQEEDPEFDREKHEREIMKEVLDGNEGYFIDANWFDIEEDKVAQSLIDLLYESRRLPEVVLLFTAEEEKVLARTLDSVGIQNQYQFLLNKLRQERREQKERERQEKIEAGEDLPEEELEEEDEEDDDPDDPEAPNLENMLEEAKQTITQKREADTNFIEELKEGLEGKGVRVILVDGNQKIEKVTQFVDYALRPNLSERQNLIERQLPIKLTKQKAEELLLRDLARLSLFKTQSPVTPNELPEVLDFPVVYKDRIYYPKNEEERGLFTTKPLFYTSSPVTAPWDLNLTPGCAVIGIPRTGKSTLASDLASALNIVKVSLKEVLEELILLDNQLSDQIRDLLTQGHELNENLKVEAICWKLSQTDVKARGYVLDNFPTTQYEALLLVQKISPPNPVFNLTAEKSSILERGKQSFKYDKKVLEERLQRDINKMRELVSWIQSNFDNVRYLSTDKSKWWVRDAAVEHINNVFQAKRKFAISHMQKKPAEIQYLAISSNEIESRLTRFLRFDPVIWHFSGELQEVEHYDNTLIYENKFYIFHNTQNMNSFISNPDIYLRAKPLPKELPRKLINIEYGELKPGMVELKGNCVVTLEDAGDVVKANPVILAAYKNRTFAFVNISARKKFLRRPWDYEHTKLPVKMPPKPVQVSLEMLSDFENSVGYLEQALGQVVIKALLEVGTERLAYPTLSPRETALKHFSVLLKCLNHKNSPYLKKKYRKRLGLFKDECSIESFLHSEGLKKQQGLLARWQNDEYLSTSENYAKLLKTLKKASADYYNKFIR